MALRDEGQYDEAMDILEYILTIPNFSTPALYRLNPALDPLHDEPRFQRLAGIELVN